MPGRFVNAMANRRAWWLVLSGLVPLLGMAPASLAQGTLHSHPNEARTAGGTDYYVWKDYRKYEDTTYTMCYGGQQWCISTVHGTPPTRLGHWHFTQSFTTGERDDVARFDQYHFGSIIIQTLDQPTTSFNCHAYALYGRGDVWLVQPAAALAADFTFCAGPPAAVGDILRYGDDGSGEPCHTAIVCSVSGTPATPASVKSKWGGGGKCVHEVTTPGTLYGGPNGRFRAR